MFHDAKLGEAVWPETARELTLGEPEDVMDEGGSWWRDVAAGSALALFAVAATVMFLR